MQKDVRSFFLVLGSIFFMFLAGCAQNISVQFPPHTPVTSGGNQLALIPPQNICLKPVQDRRIPGYAEGSREAAFGVPMGNIQFRPPASDIVRDVIVSEFKNAGHTITDKEQPITISAKILAFNVGTNTTPLYWDVIGNTTIEVEVMGSAQEPSKMTYTSSCQDRTYIWPGEALVKQVMQSCINDFADQMRNDIKLAQTIKTVTNPEK